MPTKPLLIEEDLPEEFHIETPEGCIIMIKVSSRPIWRLRPKPRAIIGYHTVSVSKHKFKEKNFTVREMLYGQAMCFSHHSSAACLLRPFDGYWEDVVLIPEMRIENGVFLGTKIKK